MKDFFARLRGQSTVTVNDKTYVGKDVHIEGGRVYVDGKQVADESRSPAIHVSIQGDVERLETGAGDVRVEGNVGSLATASGDVQCGDVAGSIATASGDVRCQGVQGSVKTVSGDIYR